MWGQRAFNRKGAFLLRNMFDEKTYKFEQEWVFSQCSYATSESEDEHHTTNHQEEPDWVETPEVGDGWDVGEDTLVKQSEWLEKSSDVWRPTEVESMTLLKIKVNAKHGVPLSKSEL